MNEPFIPIDDTTPTASTNGAEQLHATVYGIPEELYGRSAAKSTADVSQRSDHTGSIRSGRANGESAVRTTKVLSIYTKGLKRMALTDGNDGGMVMPVAPMNNFTGGAFGNGFGDGGWWILLLFILLGNGGFGNGYGGNNMLYPWMNQSNQVNDGFRDQMMNTTINGIQQNVTSGFGDIQNALCAGFAGVNASINNSQMAAMERAFDLQSQFANCCCENRLATCQTQNIVQNEGAATRLAIQNQTQQILDKMCQQEIDALKAQNAALQTQVNMLNLAASQTAQTAALVADNTAQTQYIVNRVAPYPIPSYTVANPNAAPAA